jgi:hypothetical protein
MKRILLALLLIAAALPFVAAPAQAVGCTGVTEVVQFPNRTLVECATGTPADGFAALTEAGFTVSHVRNYPGALCQINNYPTQPCVQMPPSSAYWSYWTGKPGGSWTYSTVGPGDDRPTRGEVRGWRFGAGKAPSIPPPGNNPLLNPVRMPPHHAGHPVRPPTPGDPFTNGPLGRSPGARATGPGGTGASGLPGATSASGGPGAAGATSNATGGPGSTAAGGPGATTSASLSSAHGSSHSWIWGLLLIAALAVAGAVAAVRRKRS